MARDVDIAWAAGLFEGEGSCMIRGKKRQPVLALSMTDEDVVRRFHTIVERGTVNTYRAYQPNRKRQWHWQVASKDDVLYVLALFWDYLGERRREVACEVIERAAKLNEHVGFCDRGHDLSLPEHVYVHAKTGKRFCRTCRSAYSRELRERGRTLRPAS